MMQWHDVNNYQPSHDGLYIVRIESDYENSGDIWYEAMHFEKGAWVDCGDIERKVTHFLIPDPIERSYSIRELRMKYKMARMNDETD